jgi:non-heme chloroperoxidase
VQENSAMPATATPLIARSVTIPGDTRLEYVERGDPAGQPVIFLHGVTDSWGSFEGVLGHLPESLRAIALSLRGHGNSSRPDQGYLMADFSSDVRAFMGALDLPPAVLVGHSMGSFVAQRFAIDHPGRTAGLVLMGSAAAMAGNREVRDLAAAVSGFSDTVDPAFVREFQAGTLARPVDPALFHAVVLESLRVPAFVWRATFSGFLALDHAPELHRIAAPALVVWGSCDAIFSAVDQFALRDHIPSARLVTYPGGGHAFHWEDPGKFAADVSRFCRELA